tara:strand:+ start:2115 stop:2600 length:486 start_codon:yes stop_codon:yes gene_type:complete
VSVLFVALQRLSELVWSRWNERALFKKGGIEYGAGHYPFLVGFHVAWLASLVLFIDQHAVPNWFWGCAYVVLQVARLWTLWALGPFWTTRIITIPNLPLVRRGPYRYLRHPNYAIVAGEVAILPMVFGAWEIALVFSLANLVILRHRITVENEALDERQTI